MVQDTRSLFELKAGGVNLPCVPLTNFPLLLSPHGPLWLGYPPTDWEEAVLQGQGTA